MNPTVLDVRGAPVPGLPGVRPRPLRPPERFDRVLRRLQPPVRLPRAVGAAGPAGPVASELRRGEASLVAHPSTLPATQGASAARRAAARTALAQVIRRSAAAAGVEPALSVAVARAESSLDPRARSADGLSVGTFQVTYDTADEMRRKIAAGTVTRPPGTDDVALGVGYLRYLDDLFGRTARLAPRLETVPVHDPEERRRFTIAAFNAGEGRVAEAQARATAADGDPTRFADVRPFLPSITRRYVERVLDYRREELPLTTRA